MRGARLLLILTLLVCSRGMSVCLDGEGLAYFCPPELLADENGESPDDCCPCPCDEDDCEEQEVASDLLVTKSVQLPADTCTLLSANHVADVVLATICPILDRETSDSGTLDNMLEVLRAGGMDVLQAMRILIPPAWQTVTMFNPVVYLISGFRWSFFEVSDVSVALSLFMVLAFLTTCLLIVWWMFRTGYRLKQ